MATEYHVQVMPSATAPLSYQRLFEGANDLVDAVEWMIEHLPTEVDRARVRLQLRRRFNHPERGGNPQATPLKMVHPKSTGRCAANTAGPVCVCGAQAALHDIDGEYWPNGCEGYVQSP